MRTWFRVSIALTILALVAFPARALAHQPAGHANKGMMPMVSVFSPKAGTVVTGNTLPVSVAFMHWKLNCAWAGKANKPGIGHYHIYLDGALVNMYCTNRTAVSMQNVAPGRHFLEVVPSDNDHGDMMYMMHSHKIPFTYRPSSALPLITPMNLGKPSITITSPKAGTTVSGSFTVSVAVQNFNLSCALYGKHNVKGYGHWHLNHDTMMGGMMGMGTMMGMSCAQSFQASTVGFKPGSHKFFAILEDNQHHPLMPEVSAEVTLNVQ
jgi:hypothetical protein